MGLQPTDLPADLEGRWLLAAIGGFYVFLAVLTAAVPTSQNDSAGAVLIVFLFVGGSGLVILLGGYRLPRMDLEPEFHSHVVNRTLAGIAVMLVILALYHLQPDTGLSEPERSLPILTGFSAVAGFAVGLSEAQAKTQSVRLERKNQELECIREELEASNERLEQFAHVASHDLREPLRMVSSYLQLIESRYADALDAEGEEFLDFAIDGADRMSDMIDSLLQYSRVSTQGEPFEPVDLEPVIEHVRRDLEVRIEESEATIDVGEVPTVEGDQGQLRQLFQNLIANAIEYSGEEPPHVEVTSRREGDRWAISVTDDGIGIDPSAQDQVFEVFHRLHSHEEHPGTGIGLALCRRIVERHGGEIRLDSEPGEGSTFTVTLPAVDRNETSRSTDSTPARNARTRRP